MRLLVVSNRLPVTVIEKERGEGKFEFKESVGGLTSGLSSYLDSLKGSRFTQMEYIWVGWPGITVSRKEEEKVRAKLLQEFNSLPVFLSEQHMENFYHGFCNKTIWPLFHYFPSYVVYNENYWSHYKKVNEIFCEAIMEIAKPDDIIWIHDYHLMLLPKLLRDKLPEATIGFFLHIPFPSFELFRQLPMNWRREILEYLLGADLIGFHTHEYTQYFLRCVLRILGLEHTMGQIVIGGHAVKVDTFPMGIDFEKFYSGATEPEVEKQITELQKSFCNFKVILSIDRLDYTKGIPNRLLGYELFLKNNPQWHKKVILVMVVVPSRVGVEHYQRIKRQINEQVSEINSKFGDINWTPILYQYKFLPFHPLVAVYNVSDVALVTPLRDGMNLIAKEYISARADKPGVLILSEMTGASKELSEAIIINPNNIEEIAVALKDALEMPEEEQIRRIKIMQKRLKRYNVVRWANEFMNSLSNFKTEQKKLFIKLLPTPVKHQLIEQFKNAKKRVLLLDYDGTLVPFVVHPYMIKPSKELFEILERVARYDNAELVLISGRDKATLQDWFGMLNINLVAEHGIWIKEKNEDWKLIKQLTSDWKPQILPILEKYTDRVPGSFIEEKEFSLVWHYRASDLEVASICAKELTDDLIHFTANIDIQVLQGNKVIEVRNTGVNKGNAGGYFISKYNPDFILAIGDDTTDEDLFKALPESAYSIKVGISASYAKFNLSNYLDVRKLISDLVK